MNQLNPLKLLQLKAAWEQLQARHPKFLAFLNILANDGIAQDSILEITVTDAQGKSINSNLKITPEDILLLKNLRELLENSNVHL
jgi:hypothetical protein